MSFGKLIVLIAFVGSIISYCVTSFINVNPTSSKFLLLELLRQSSLVYALVQMIGLAYYFQVKFLPKNPTFAVLPWPRSFHPRTSIIFDARFTNQSDSSNHSTPASAAYSSMPPTSVLKPSSANFASVSASRAKSSLVTASWHR